MCVVIQERLHCKCLSQVFRYETSLLRSALSMIADEGFVGIQAWSLWLLHTKIVCFMLCMDTISYTLYTDIISFVLCTNIICFIFFTDIIRFVLCKGIIFFILYASVLCFLYTDVLFNVRLYTDIISYYIRT